MSDQESQRFPAVKLMDARTPYEHPQHLPNLPVHQPAVLPRPKQGSGAPSIFAQTVPSAQPVSDAHHYAFLSDLVVAVPESSVLFLDQPPNRRNMLMLRNSSGIGGPNLYISFGTPAGLNATLVLGPATAANPSGQIAMFDTVVPQNDCYAFADAAGGSLSYAYGNMAQ
jgi:hypothetical protein